MAQATYIGKDIKNDIDKINQLKPLVALKESRINEKIIELEQDIAAFTDSLEATQS